MLLETLLFFALCCASATVAGLPRRMLAWRVAGIVPALAAIAVAAVAIGSTEGDWIGAAVLGGLVLVAATAVWLRQPAWGALAALLVTAVVGAAIAYLAYALLQTVDQGAHSAPVVLASVGLLLLELAALALTVSYAFEIVDVLGRTPEPPPAPPNRVRWPVVAIQVPCYNEPVEVVQPTLEALARLRYPSLIVQVVDNNTTDAAVWRPLERVCAQMGPRFHFLHLDPWPGFKAGALNEATRRLPPEVEVVGIVDADYEVSPDFLLHTVQHFNDPTVAFVQTAQHYRDWEDDGYLRGLFYSFRYFFDVTMPARAHRNAIIFAGTMGLIRRAALEAVGGWNERCITEDAEASLRMLGLGRLHRGVYDRRAFGAGLMPLTFDGLKKQRFRWALGGIQILRMHWRELLPFAPHRLALTRAQRIHYLLGSVQWFGDLLTACFTLLLLATAAATALHHSLPLRQLTGSVVVIPLVFLATGVLRAVWAMRRTTGCRWADGLRGLRVWFALSWVVSLACLRGLLSSRAEFLRTPKRRQGAATLAQALRSSRAETTVAAAALLAAAAMLLRDPEAATAVIAALLVFQAVVYSSAPWASAAAEGIPLTPQRQRYLRSPRIGGEPAARPGSVVLPAALAAAAAAVVAGLVVTSPTDQAPFQGGGQVDTPPIGRLGGAPSQATPAPTPRPSRSTPRATASPRPSPSAGPTPTASPR